MAKCKKCAAAKIEICEDCGGKIIPVEKFPYVFRPKDIREDMVDCYNCKQKK